MQVPEELLMKFPAIFRNKLQSGEVILQDNVKFEYSPILAYRCVRRKKADNSPPVREDFLSNAELGRNKIKGMQDGLEFVPEYYGVSFFQDEKELEVKQHLPMKNRKIIFGHIYQEGGPALEGKDTHVCWWLYEDTDVSNFQLKDDMGNK